MQRLAWAVGLVMTGYYFVVWQSNHTHQPEYLFYVLASLPAALGAFFLCDWIITGRHPFRRVTSSAPNALKSPRA